MHSRLCFFVTMIRHPLPSTLFPYTTLFRSGFYGFVQPSEFGLLTDNTDGQQDFNGANLALAVGLAQGTRSEEHTSELQSRFDLVCRLLLEKKKIEKAAQGESITHYRRYLRM